MISLKFVLFVFVQSQVYCKLKHKPEITFTLGSLGSITGLESRTKIYENAPYNNRTTYQFRGIPYAYPVVDQDRFKQSDIMNDTTLTSDGSSFNATRDGPLCQQGTTTDLALDTLTQSTIRDLVKTLVGDLIPDILLDGVIDIITGLLEQLFELPDGFLDKDKLVGDVLHDWLDITISTSEDCLHLAVDTPWKPDGTVNKSMPVMFFIHGGAFAFGTQIRMGGERLQAWDDVVVVSINYRVGSLGFLCLDTDEAAGNMGMLDMVVALEWVHQFIGYFGGDPRQITIFGESAGSASIGHLVLSKETNGLFSKGIGQSGSAVASWAFDEDPEYDAKMIARIAGCTDADIETHDGIVDCLRSMPAQNVSAAYKDWSKVQRKDGLDGFGGTTPCIQTKGKRKFYSEGQTPDSILYDGAYEAVPILFGANSHEGSYVYGAVYNDFIIPNNLTNDTDFLRDEMIHTLMGTVGVTNSYAVEHMIEEAYFDPWMMGNLTAMQPGMIDLLSVFFLKASAYEFMAQNSQHNNSFWYAFDYKTPQKSVFHMLFPQTDKKADVDDIGVCHADELMYIFDMELPLMLCDLGSLLADFATCLQEPLTLEDCILNGPMHKKWEYCLTGNFFALSKSFYDVVLGELTEEETRVSSYLTKMWTSFAVSGHPGFGAKPWSSKNPVYLKVSK